jgi:hypothetical protein
LFNLITVLFTALMLEIIGRIRAFQLIFQHFNLPLLILQTMFKRINTIPNIKRFLIRIMFRSLLIILQSRLQHNNSIGHFGNNLHFLFKFHHILLIFLNNFLTLIILPNFLFNNSLQLIYFIFIRDVLLIVLVVLLSHLFHLGLLLLSLFVMYV